VLLMALHLGSSLLGNLDGSVDLKVWFAGAKDVYPHVNQIASSPEPTVKGNPDDFLTSKGEAADEFRPQMKNKIRKCPTCSKVVAFTLASCNGCGADLRAVDITFSNNIFTSFCYGIEKGPFPFTISMRSSENNILVFDDLLSLTPCHVNVIPANVYCPDWRFLLLKPKEGLQLINSMYDAAQKVVREQFLGNKEWCQKILKNFDSLTEEQILSHLCVGCNYPPSQYQLHLQFMLPPFLPYHYRLYLDGLHFTYERFFPVEYIKAVLALDETYPVKDDTPIEEIIAYFKTKGVDYHEIHKTAYDGYGASHRALSNWALQDFNHVVVNDALYDVKGDQIVPHEGSLTSKDLIPVDKMVLQNYGRPYSEAGKPTGGYYGDAVTTKLADF